MIPWRLLSALALAGVSLAIQVDSPEPWHVAILFQPVVLKCQYDTSANQPPTIVWKYKSFCRDRILDAFNPSSSTNLVNDQLLQADPNYDPYVNCPDASRTVRIVASKRGKAVSLDQYYQGRKITIIGDADLSIEQTAWGDSGVYYCTVTAFEDLSGNNEAYVELLVLDWLFVVLVCLGAFILLILIGVCWCQCCPHTCCCYLRCPCCPDKCCCPYALYHAGKAATAGAPSVYAPSSYAASAYSHPGLAKMGPPAPFMVPMTQFNGSYGSEFDAASSVGNHSRVPLLHDQDAPSSVRSGYRIQANQQNDDMRVLYYVEKELANFDPRAPSDPVGRYENASAMSEISSLHDGPPPSRLLPRDPPPRLPPWEEERGGSSAGSSVSRQNPRRTSPPRGRERGWGDSRQRARSMESLDEISWGGGGGWGRRGGGERERERERERGRGRGDRTPLSRDRSPERRYLSRSRDDLTEREWERERERETGGRDRGRGGREREKGGRDPPQPPPYTETESVASSSRSKNEKKLRKNDAVSRESLVV